MVKKTPPTPEDYYALPSHLDRTSFDLQAQTNAETIKNANPLTWVATPTPDQLARQHPTLAARQAERHSRPTRTSDGDSREERRSEGQTPIVAPTPVRVARAILRTPPSVKEVEPLEITSPSIVHELHTDHAMMSETKARPVEVPAQCEQGLNVAPARKHETPVAETQAAGAEQEEQAADPPGRAPFGQSTLSLLAWLSSETQPVAAPFSPPGPVPMTTAPIFSSPVQPPTRYPRQTQLDSQQVVRAFGFGRAHQEEREPRVHAGPPPRYDPGPAYEQQESLRRSRPFKLGGRSKNEELGSVEESWGPVVMVGEDGEVVRAKGMFQIRDDPPSRSTSPFKPVPLDEEDAIRQAEEQEPMEPFGPPKPPRRPERIALHEARLHAFKLARAGTGYEGRPPRGNGHEAYRYEYER